MQTFPFSQMEQNFPRFQPLFNPLFKPHFKPHCKPLLKPWFEPRFKPQSGGTCIDVLTFFLEFKTALVFQLFFFTFFHLEIAFRWLKNPTFIPRGKPRFQPHLKPQSEQTPV